MKILIVGGTGMIGGHAALHLRRRGNDVTIAGRNRPAAGTPLGELDFLRCDYIANDLPAARLGAFDALVFAAGNDVRHVPPGGDEAAHWERANVEGVPRFFRTARDAGIRTAVHVGSFYPQAAPRLADDNAYIRSRKLADEGVRALATDAFRVNSVNAPFVVGTVPGLTVPMFKAYTDYARGGFAPMPDFAPPGGVNFISARSLSEAIEGALLRGENGNAYLVGDENLSFQDYFGAFFRDAGRPVPPVIDQEHPLLPDSAICFGRGNTLYYEPDAAETALLGYRRGDILRTVSEIVAQYR
ncbi:NAD-dependent epimerase/dehydratase family protein [Cupriavidus neocaledonicus]|uniref:Nucleoside-diphosphate-sugar epimerase n=1 Tax=Cupriavidus neocaledonicus TaxID=1040979 RepID=A0A375HV57_9BURK|nr:NAD-dependent epimerase/dehydratase family protein [Cupriavidus neocaledonicus]SOZ40081.1 Nucleoside-diphosphate-sugar epimerase [Cupriavidus neocaledonicus]SPD60577.1 Nucleoside-diphosphate-sugar epimerase [Cupriavidus neocaledonicus]